MLTRLRGIAAGSERAPTQNIVRRRVHAIRLDGRNNGERRLQMSGIGNNGNNRAAKPTRALEFFKRQPVS